MNQPDQLPGLPAPSTARTRQRYVQPHSIEILVLVELLFHGLPGAALQLLSPEWRWAWIWYLEIPLGSDTAFHISVVLLTHEPKVVPLTGFVRLGAGGGVVSTEELEPDSPPESSPPPQVPLILILTLCFCWLPSR